MTPLLARKRPETLAPRASNPSQTVVLLGPQIHEETVAATLKSIGVSGKIGVVTAGWQEREEEVQALADHIEGRAVHLKLHARALRVFDEDPRFEEVHRARQKRLRDLQRLYNVRIDHAMGAVEELARLRGKDALAAEAWEAAVDTVQSIDADHLDRIRTTHEEYRTKLDVENNPAVSRHRRELRKDLDGCDALAIAGGHVAVLLNRLRLFGVVEAMKDRPVVAWSAGAMALTERVILYHDSPPQGPGNAEVLEAGLGVVLGVVPLPHAKHRLQVGNPDRISRFARRFAPDLCLAMDEGARVTVGPKGWSASAATKRLTEDGHVVKAEGAAR